MSDGLLRTASRARSRPWGRIAAAVLLLAAPAAGAAAPLSTSAADLDVWLRADGIASPQLGVDYVDVLGSTLDVDLERSAGWRGAAAHLDLIHTFALSPRPVLARLQFIDNDAVQTRHFRVYQAWIEQGFRSGGVSLGGGVYDLKTEFAALDAADLLVNPSFGVNPELSGGRTDGAPTFPSTSLAARLKVEPGSDMYVLAAAIDARAGTLGDPGGVDLSFRDGELLAGEVGYEKQDKVAIGAWRYAGGGPWRRGLRLGQAPSRPSAGVYALFEKRLSGNMSSAPGVTIFARAGLADDVEASFTGSWQAGLQVERLLATRPESVLTIGVSQAAFAGGPRARTRTTDRLRAPETAVEIAYADRLAPNLTIQPDLQWVRHAGCDRFARDSFVFLVRATFRLPPLSWSGPGG